MLDRWQGIVGPLPFFIVNMRRDPVWWSCRQYYQQQQPLERVPFCARARCWLNWTIIAHTGRGMGVEHVFLPDLFMNLTVWQRTRSHSTLLPCLSTARTERTSFQRSKPPSPSPIIISSPPSPSPCTDPVPLSPTNTALCVVVLVIIADIAIWIIVPGRRSASSARRCAKVEERAS